MRSAEELRQWLRTCHQHSCQLREYVTYVLSLNKNEFLDKSLHWKATGSSTQPELLLFKRCNIHYQCVAELCGVRVAIMKKPPNRLRSIFDLERLTFIRHSVHKHFAHARKRHQPRHAAHPSGRGATSKSVLLKAADSGRSTRSPIDHFIAVRMSKYGHGEQLANRDPGCCTKRI